MKWILLAFLLMPIEVTAATDGADLRLMMQSSNTKQMQQSLSRTREVPRLRALCAAQLRKKYVPEACFEALVLQQHPVKPEAWLVDNCVRAVPAVQDLRVLGRLLKASTMPEACHAEVQKRYDDLRYAAETEAPATLFESGSGENADSSASSDTMKSHSIVR